VTYCGCCLRNINAGAADIIPVLTLHVPRKVELPQTQTVVDPTAAGGLAADHALMPSQPGSASKGKKRPGGHQSFATATKGKPAPVVAAPIPQEVVKVVEIDMFSGNKRARKPSGPAPLSFNASVVAPNIDFSDVTTSAASTYLTTAQSNKLHAHLNQFFEYFWELELDNTQANAAFFGRINEYNYLEFGLIHFMVDHVNFPVIKVRHICFIAIVFSHCILYSRGWTTRPTRATWNLSGTLI
jgi:hypothetical protein